MHFEMVGSLLIFATLLLFAKFRAPWALIFVAFGVTVGTWTYGYYACFLAGLAFAGLRAQGAFVNVQRHPWRRAPQGQ